MAPQRGNGFDQISMMIGELKGSVGEIEKYVHEGRHGINNLSQKMDGLAVKIAADIAAVEARMDSRLKALEANQNNWSGARMLAAWLVQTLIATVVAIVAVISMRHNP